MPTNPHEPPKGRRIIAALAIFALVVVPLAIYVAGYLWLGQRRDYISLTSPTQITLIERNYRPQWAVGVFKPAGRIESWLRGIQVDVIWHGPSLLDLDSIIDGVS